uniref:Uncharacterized protein n=1 Tax=Oryza glumipatula TaxID=40148 RepID=A0A0E0AQ83_9ORYZ
MQRRGKTERSDADDGRAAGGRVGCGRAWGRGRARGRRRWMRPGCSFFFQAFGSLNPCRRARIQWRFLELLGLVTEVGGTYKGCQIEGEKLEANTNYGKILVLVWAQLQRRHFEIKLIKNAYRKFESTIMHIFVNFGWRFTNRIQ